MTSHITYYVSHVSPYNYLGAARFRKIVEGRNLTVEMKIMDLSQVFPKTGGLPLPQRAPERLAYRLQELRRFSEFYALPLTLQPSVFPPSSGLGALVLAQARQQDVGLAMQVLEVALGMTWADEKDSGDIAQLTTALNDAGLSGDALIADAQANQTALQAAVAADSEQAVADGVFGAPSFKIGDEMFWGQDRLDMLCWYLDNHA